MKKITARSVSQGSWVGCVLLVLISFGCSPQSPPSNTKDRRESSDGFPPLKIAIVEADSLESELALRWQTFSDQKLQIVSMPRDAFSSQDVSTVDVLIFPGDFLGTLVERNWITPIPSQVKDRIGGWSTANATRDSEAQPPSTWPSRWHSLSTFGGKVMAVPLGAPSWIAITRGLDVQPLLELHQKIASNQNSSEVSTKNWEAFLTSAEAKFASNQSERENELMQALSHVSSEEKRWLASRFLWMISSSESRYRGMFDLYKLQSRWNQPEFARSARYLRRLALLSPSTIIASPTEAWESVERGAAPFAIGWPRSDNQQRLDEDARELAKRVLLPIVWNDGSGLMASLGRRTRQSANAAEFLVWLSADEQRLALQSKTERVELIEIDNDQNRVREDYREYQTMQRLESGNLSFELTPRFAYSERFLSLLGDALVDTLRNPDQTSERFLQCRQDWDALVDQIGRETIRVSLEAATGYAQ